MKSKFVFQGKAHEVDLNDPIDISIPLRNGTENPFCYGADPVAFETITAGDFVGSVNQGGPVNHRKVTVTPHGNGTHTECFGHISEDVNATLNLCLQRFHFIAELITLVPEGQTDEIITLPAYQSARRFEGVEALVVRTLPNTQEKKLRNYTNTNPPYLDPLVCQQMAKEGILHLLIDLPSVDREFDGGKLVAHKAFWQFPSAIRKEATITELIYVDESIPDGIYLLNLQITSLVMDASPSKPVLYRF